MTSVDDIRVETYAGEHCLPRVSSLIERELSEPYSVFTYRYFVNQWPELCFIAVIGDKSVGTIVSKLEKNRVGRQRGYIAMLAVDPAYRGRKIGSALVKMSVARMTAMGADEIVLETEMTNAASIALYEKLGFSRTKLLRRYYMNGNDAYRLKLFITEPHTNVLL